MKTEENRKYDNPPAFACVTESYGQDGMSLRDYFANSVMLSLVNKFDCYQTEKKERIAKESYEMADEMLKQREQ